MQDAIFSLRNFGRALTICGTLEAPPSGPERTAEMQILL
jgi:hypothetical protein